MGFELKFWHILIACLFGCKRSSLSIENVGPSGICLLGSFLVSGYLRSNVSPLQGFYLDFLTILVLLRLMIRIDYRGLRVIAAKSVLEITTSVDSLPTK